MKPLINPLGRPPVKPLAKPLIVICGPTACGKTAVAIALAKQINAEIVSADSMQIYRGMDIGTAKPTIAEQNNIPHHLIDILDPWEKFSAAMFQQMAREAIDDIHNRGKVPILAGGTGFYINAVIYDNLLVPDFPRENLNLWYNTLFIVLYRDRERLYEAIERRVDNMIDQGLVGEVERLLLQIKTTSAKTIAIESSPQEPITALQAIGYKEIIPYLEGQCSLEEAKSAIKLGSRRYAKRQLTWFRNQNRNQNMTQNDNQTKNQYIHWLSTDDKEPEEAAEEIRRIYNGEKLSGHDT